MTEFVKHAGRHLQSPHLYFRILAFVLLLGLLFLFQHLAIFLIFTFLSIRAFGFLGKKIGRLFKFDEKYGVLICLFLLLAILGLGMWLSIHLGFRSLCPPVQVSSSKKQQESFFSRLSHLGQNCNPSVIKVEKPIESSSIEKTENFVEQKANQLVCSTFSFFDTISSLKKKEEPKSFLESLQDFRNELVSKVPSCIPVSDLFDKALPRIKSFLSENGAHYAQNIGKIVGRVLLEVLLGFIVAMIYLLERKKVSAFLAELTRGEILSHASKYLGFIGDAIIITVQLQVMVALVNTVLTLPILLVLQLPRLGLLLSIVFVSSLIPILGNFISGAVLVVFSYLHQGLLGAVLFLGITAILHKIEAYYLNPRLSSRHVNLPMVVLVFSLICFEHFLGFIGVFLSFPCLYVAIKVGQDFKKGMTASLLTVQENESLPSLGLEGP